MVIAMNKSSSLSTFYLGIGLVFGVAFSLSTSAAGDIARGRTLYTTQCQSCHGAATNVIPRRCANSTPVLNAAISNISSMRFLASILSTQDRDDITAYVGNPNDTTTNTPPVLSYSPATTLSLTGSSAVLGAVAIGTISVSAAGGTGTGSAATTNFNQCAISGSGFTVASVNFSFVGSSTAPQTFTPSCTRTAVAQSATLSCKETRGSGAVIDRSWQLTCPASAIAPVPPALSYLPEPGNKVLLTTSSSLPAAQATAFVYIDPTGGVGSGVAANKTISECSIAGADATAFSLPSSQEITLRPDGPNGYIDVNCTRDATAVRTSTLSCVERTGGVNPVSKSWPLSCPSMAQITPQTGWYWNAQEGGRGYFIENRNGSLFMAAFLYTPAGPAWWFVGAAPLTGPDFSSTMFTLENGQTLTGAYKAPVMTSSPGIVQLKFASDSTAKMTWPGGTVDLIRFPITDLTTVKPPQAGAPEPGWWWSDKESGRGFSIGFEADKIFICGFMYDASGQPTWYVSTGTMSTPSQYEGPWLLLANGQAMGAPYKPADTINANVGLLKLNFTDRRNANMTLPDGRVIELSRQPQ